MVNWLYVDLNSYFASVEQQLNPALRGKPVAVVPMLAETTSCLAASYEAKAFGVKTGVMVSDARKMCPGIQFVTGDHRKYVEYHERIIEAVESCIHVTKVASIDEMACKLTGRDRQTENAMELGREVKQAILKVGECLTSSVGLAPSRYIAKIACDMQKPDGLTIIQKHELPNRLLCLKTRDLPGVGYRMEERLITAGIRTMEQLIKADVHRLRSIWNGINGERMFHWLRGEDLEYFVTDETKSIGHSHVLPPKQRTQAGAYAVAQKLLHKSAFRLRKAELLTQGFVLSIRYTNRERWTGSLRLTPCQDTHSLSDALRQLWSQSLKANPMKVRPMKISMSFYDFIPEKEATISMFDNSKREQASKAMDTINSKYGKHVLFLADMQGAEESAPNRIAFSSIPDYEVD